MFRLILITLLTFLGFHDNGPKHDLRKQPTREDYINQLRAWVDLNFGFIALAAMIGVILFFVWFCFWSAGVSAVESGMYYNNFEQVI
ncbi:MAG: hypothetical protein J6M91_04640 [Methanobrevibacter sp.]|nr:hypothetical protein [Methanobrevibacter sp.]